MSNGSSSSGPAPGSIGPWPSSIVQRRVEELDALGEPGTEAATLAALAALDEHRRRIDERGVVLYAGTNVIAPEVARYHDVQLGMRPSMGPPGEKAQPGLASLEIVERFAARTVAATVGAAHADVRLPSGTLANLGVYAGLLDIGETIAALPIWAGGHVSHHEEGAAGLRGHRVVELPYDHAMHDVDLALLPDFLDRHRPQLVIVGGALPLFPYRLRELAGVVHASGARLLYDASHTVGLIAGGRHQAPLAEGADVVTFSTYKSFGAPAGGVIAVSDMDIARRVDRAVYPRLTANYDAGRLAPLGLTATDLLLHGEGLARRSVEAARALAGECDRLGLAPLGRSRGFTESHVLALAQPGQREAQAAVDALAEAGVYTSLAQSCDEGGVSWALRLGTQELIRRGFDASDMPRLAKIIARVLVDRESPREVRAAAVAFRASADEPLAGSAAGDSVV